MATNFANVAITTLMKIKWLLAKAFVNTVIDKKYSND